MSKGLQKRKIIHHECEWSRNSSGGMYKQECDEPAEEAVQQRVGTHRYKHATKARITIKSDMLVVRYKGCKECVPLMSKQDTEDAIRAIYEQDDTLDGVLLGIHDPVLFWNSKHHWAPASVETTLTSTMGLRKRRRRTKSVTRFVAE